MDHRAAASQCPECDFEIAFHSQPKRGAQTTCPNCMTLLVVLRLNPLELDWAFQEPLDHSKPAGGRGRTDR